MKRLSLALLISLAACSSSTEYADIAVSPAYDPALVRLAAKNGALITEVVGSPTEFTGARAVADAMEMPPYFHGILLAGEPPTGSGTQSTRLVLAFNSSKRATPDRMCEDAAAIRPGRGSNLDLIAVLCVGSNPVSHGKVEGGSYSSMTLKEFRALSIDFLGRVMPAGRS